jgi:hypothetical protein
MRRNEGSCNSCFITVVYNKIPFVSASFKVASIEHLQKNPIYNLKQIPDQPFRQEYTSNDNYLLAQWLVHPFFHLLTIRTDIKELGN